MTWQRAVTIFACLVVLLPVVGDAVLAIRSGWEPIGDNAIIMMQSADVATSENPDLGMPTAMINWSSHRSYHPGPAVYWSLAPVAWLFGTSGVASLVVVAVVRVVCTLVILGICRRLAGVAGLIAGATAIFLVVLWAPDLYGPINPSIAFMPMALTIFLCWAVLAGSRWAPVGVLIGSSYAIQADLGYVPIAAPLVLLTWAVVAIRFRRGEGERYRRPLAIGGLAICVMWALPLWDAVTNGGGNLWQIVAGFLDGNVPSQQLDGVVGVGLWLVLGAATACILLMRTADGPLRQLALLVLVLVVADLVLRWIQPTGGTIAPSYALDAVKLAVAFAPLLVLLRFAQRLGTKGWLRLPVILVVLGLVGWGAIVSAQRLRIRHDWAPYQYAYSAGQVLADQILHATKDATGNTVVVRPVSGFGVRDIAITAAVALDSDGLDVRVKKIDGLVPYFGEEDLAATAPDAPRIWVVDGRAPHPPTPRSRLIAEWRPTAQVENEVRALDAAIKSYVVDHSPLVVEGSAFEIDRIIEGWSHVPAQWTGDSSTLENAPGSVLTALYAQGLVKSPSLPGSLLGDAFRLRAAHDIKAYLVE